MSASTIILKRPPQFPDPLMKCSISERKSPFLLVSSLWLFSSIFSAVRIDFSSNMSGITIAFNMQDVVVITFAAWMLHKGLTTRTIALIFPWILVSLYGLWYNQYKSLAKMMETLRHYRHATALPWFGLFATSVGLVLRVALILRILQLSANLWYRKKLEKELYDT